MKKSIDPNSLIWWFWLLTLLFILAALMGWNPGYYLVMLMSLVQVFYFFRKEKNLMAFPTQIRLVYLLFTLSGFWPAGRFYFFLVLFLGTMMVTFFGRCSIAMVLKRMPWNKNREIRLN
ncbi:MAG: hypothetical protein V2I46_00980 [Bacteroides sp.]|jgi:hypothetical protein|nr:hypothetical protein [Bacteroides sp.]